MENQLKQDIIIIAAASLAALHGAYIGNVTPIALPQMATVFGLSNIMQNWVTNIFPFNNGNFRHTIWKTMWKIWN